MRPFIGGIVVARTGLYFNGTDLHPAIITRVWNDVDTETGVGVVNLQVLPDCGAPFPLNSVHLFHTEQQALDGCGLTAFWATPKPAAG